MVDVRSGVTLSKDNCSAELFDAQDDGFVLDVYPVDDGDFLLVKEVASIGLKYTFFDLCSGLKVDPESRFLSENGRKIRCRLDAGVTAEILITVQPKTGVELVCERVVRGGDVLYETNRERYPERSPEEIYQKYLVHKDRRDKSRELAAKLERDFGGYSFNEKVMSLRGEFRKKWRANCELGFENPEYFISRDIYKILSKSSDFKRALMEMLKLEERFIGCSAEDIFESIEMHYER